MFQKTHRTNARGDPEITMFDNLVTVFKFIGDCYFYVVGEIEENEIILGAVLQGFYEAVASLLSVVDKKAVLENLDLVLLCMDELVDGGIILETDPQQVVALVTMRQTDGGELPFGEQSFQQAMNMARDQLARNLLR